MWLARTTCRGARRPRRVARCRCSSGELGARQACDLGQEASEHPLFRLPLKDVVEPTHGLVDEGVGLRAGLDLQVDRLAAVQELSNLFQRLQAMGVERHDHPPMTRDPAPVQAHLSLEEGCTTGL